MTFGYPFDPLTAQLQQLSNQISQLQTQQSQPQIPITTPKPQSYQALTAQGIEPIKNMDMPPNSSAIILDTSSTDAETIFTFVSTDSTGTKTIRRYKAFEFSDTTPGPEYTSKEDFEKFKESITATLNSINDKLNHRKGQ